MATNDRNKLAGKIHTHGLIDCRIIIGVLVELLLYENKDTVLLLEDLTIFIEVQEDLRARSNEWDVSTKRLRRVKSKNITAEYILIYLEIFVVLLKFS